MSRLLITDFEGVLLSQSDSHSDNRGTFTKIFPKKLLREQLNSVAISINPIIGTIRGLHFQIEPLAEEKIVSCLAGAIFDVIVDIRPNSKTFGMWTSFELSSSNGINAFLPKGIAHGFQVLEANTIVHYCLTSSYSPEAAITINPLSDFGIEWPISEFIISEKDASGITVAAAALAYSTAIMDQ